MTNRNQVSRFAVEIPPELIERKGVFGRSRAQEFYRESVFTDPGKRTAPRGGALSREKARAAAVSPRTNRPSGASYKVGETVTSKAFGKGVVISVKAMGNDCMLEIAFEKHGTKKLMANYAKLEKE